MANTRQVPATPAAGTVSVNSPSGPAKPATTVPGAAPTVWTAATSEPRSVSCGFGTGNGVVLPIWRISGGALKPTVPFVLTPGVLVVQFGGARGTTARGGTVQAASATEPGAPEMTALVARGGPPAEPTVKAIE